MVISDVLKQAFHWLTLTVSNYIKYARSRKTVTLAVAVILFLYISSSYLLPAHRHFRSSSIQRKKVASPSESCLQKILDRWNELTSESNAILKRYPHVSSDNKFYPFSGNGYVGVSFEDGAIKFYRLSEDVSIEIPDMPFVDILLFEEASESTQIISLNIMSGSIHRLSSYIVNKSCVTVHEMFYVHRIHKSLFMQHIEVENDGKMPVHVKLFLKESRASRTKKTRKGFNAISGSVKSNLQEMANFTTVFSDFQSTIEVPQKSKNKLEFVSVTKFDQLSIGVVEEAEGELKDVQAMKTETLHEQHVRGWKEIWKVGVSIASDSDPDSPTSLHVNLTEYYIYALSPYNLSTPTRHKDCFSGPPTIRNAALWVMPSSMISLYNLKNSWGRLIARAGCSNQHVNSFVVYREAMTLSFLGLQYKPYHLQLSFNPLNLRSNISVRSLPMDWFHSRDVLDLKLTVNKATSEQWLYVASEGEHDPPLYICSTACKHVVVLGVSTLILPVFTTDPVTPLLYISTNKTHLDKVGSTTFMKMALENAKASHQLHLENHHTKLSPKFWLAIIVLIVSFHVVVIKMIYNECRSNRSECRRK